jgi:hypothetical protein
MTRARTWGWRALVAAYLGFLVWMTATKPLGNALVFWAGALGLYCLKLHGDLSLKGPLVGIASHLCWLGVMLTLPDMWGMFPAFAGFMAVNVRNAVRFWRMGLRWRAVHRLPTGSVHHGEEEERQRQDAQTRDHRPGAGPAGRRCSRLRQHDGSRHRAEGQSDRGFSVTVARAGRSVCTPIASPSAGTAGK